MVTYGFVEGIGLGFVIGWIIGVTYVYLIVRSIAKKRKVWDILNEKHAEQG